MIQNESSSRVPILRRVAVLGAGTMGAAIAAHLANAGLEVLLLDLPPRELSEQEKAAGLDPQSPKHRNRLALAAIAALDKHRPAPLFTREFASRIEAGNFEDDLDRLAEMDWVIEVVVERLDIKQSLLSKVEAVAGDSTIISSNTSGIPIASLCEGHGESFQRRFLGTHFFNPPRYMHLLEVIPGPKTDPALVETLRAFADERLGKGVVVAKDRPNFVANRIGCYGMMRTAELMLEHDLGVDAVDALTGPFLGRAKSATFRTADLVGLDVLLHVAENVKLGAPDDPELEVFTPIPQLTRMVKEGLLGEKTQKGFFQKTKVDGKRVIQTLDLKTFEYRDREKAHFPEIDALKGIDDLRQRLRGVFKAKGKGAAFCWAVLRDTLRYAAEVAAEIADDLPSIDRALCWGFGWQLGPFQVWDAMGFNEVIQRMEDDGRPAPEWVKEFAKSNASGFYQQSEDGAHQVALPDGSSTAPLRELPGVIDLKLPSQGIRKVAGNSGASLWDLGDGVLGLEFHSKMNSIGGEILSMTAQANERVVSDFRGLVVGNQGQNFSVGANLALLLMAAIEGEYEEIDLIVRQFQRTTMSLKTCPRPVVVAPFGLTLGGGCEYTLHGARVHASAELYLGLVEGGVGLIPAGGGTKEYYLRMLERLGPKADPMEAARRAFETIGMAKVSTSAVEAQQLGFLRASDSLAMNPDRLIAGAKAEVIALAEAGYVAPHPREDIPVSGADGRALLEVGLYNMLTAGYISEHDRLIGRKLARILTGGEVVAGAKVSEQHLLDLEREAFLSLCGERKSLERIQYMLKKGKPLRN